MHTALENLNVTADTMPIADAYEDDTRDNPLAYLDAYDSSYEEEPTGYSQHSQDEEELYDNQWNASPDMPEPEAEAEEDLYSYDSDTPEHPDTTENPEMPERGDNKYDWPTTGMAGPTAKEYWNPEMTGLEDNKPSSTMHDQMTLAEVTEWLQEPSDQVVFERYDRPN